MASVREREMMLVMVLVRVWGRQLEMVLVGQRVKASVPVLARALARQRVAKVRGRVLATALVRVREVEMEMVSVRVWGRQLGMVLVGQRVKVSVGDLWML